MTKPMTKYGAALQKIPSHKGLPWKLERTGDNVVTVRMDDVGQGWERWVLLRTDVHHDNPKCDQALEEKHLKQAIERDAMIIDNGDLFCAMQGGWDPRKSKDAIRPEHVRGDYLDALVETAAEFYRPYAKNFAVLGKGNHETAISKRHESDLTKRLAAELVGMGSPVLTSGYGGWVRFLFTVRKTVRMSKNLYHFHGYGGGGPVTRGVIQTNRIGVYTPDADIVFTGHSHDCWIMPVARVRLNEAGVIQHDEQLFLRAAGYKDAWGTGYGGWEVETGKGPKPKSAMWLRWYYEDGIVKVEPRRAM